MKLNLKNRKSFLIVALVVTVLLAIFAPQNQDSIELARDTKPHLAKANNPSAQSANTNTTIEHHLLPNKRSLSDQKTGELFLVDRVKQAKNSASQTPVAPPLPYIYMGKIIDDGKLTVFLTRDDRAYAIKAGDTIDNQYMVNAVTPQRIELTYLPLGQKQTMMTGAN